MAGGSEDSYRENSVARSLKVMILCLLFSTLFFPKKVWLGGGAEEGSSFPSEGFYDATGVLLREGG